MQRKTATALRTLFIGATLCAGLGVLPACAQGFQADITHARLSQLSPLRLLAPAAISADEKESDDAIKLLRDAGPIGMTALQMALEEKLRDYESHPEKQSEAEWARIQNAMEKVGAQRDNWASGLYWFTDLSKAQAEAKKQNKPILSLRLLGNLDEELSCANSRFFRTALYPNARIQQFLNDHYILHWQSVRPVPKVTIDFGDGRKIETTLTGNSIHYALDSDGRVLDALPGLYAPGAFLRWLQSAQNLNEETIKLEGEARQKFLSDWHETQLQLITRTWQNDFGTLKHPVLLNPQVDLKKHFDIRSEQSADVPNAQIQTNAQAAMPPQIQLAPDETLIKVTPIQITPTTLAPFEFKTTEAKPTARQAAPIPTGKAILETPLLQRVAIAVPRDRDALQRKTDDALWQKIAALYSPDAWLDKNSLRVLHSKTPRAEIVAVSFQKSIAEDSVRNEYLRHAVLHQWLMENPNFDLSALNKKVYAEIFLTPDSDPWLGLLPEEAYSAIPNDGVTRGEVIAP